MRWWQLVRVPDRAPEWSLVVPEDVELASSRLRKATYRSISMNEWRPRTHVSALPGNGPQPLVRAHYVSEEVRTYGVPTTAMTVRLEPEPGGGCRARATFRQARLGDVYYTVYGWLVLAATIGVQAAGEVVALTGRRVPTALIAVPPMVSCGVGLQVLAVRSYLRQAAPQIEEQIAALRYWLARSLRAPEAEELLGAAPGAPAAAD